MEGVGPGFTEMDAMLAYFMIRELKPKRIIEIGSGISTLYCWMALKENTHRTEPVEIACIDPHIVKIDGDVPYLYLEVIPKLKPGYFIHVHDVHFPYNVPFPSEPYVLRLQVARLLE